MNDNSTLICECGNPKHYRSPGCQRCMDLDHDRIAGETRRKVLGMLRHLDWCTTTDLCIALDVVGEIESRPYRNMLRTLAREGLVETKGRNSGMEYRMVQRKRRAA